MHCGKQLTQENKHRETSKQGQGGNHASPRMHLRRGHLRRLPNKVVWVKEAMVNAKSQIGVVDKDYCLS